MSIELYIQDIYKQLPTLKKYKYPWEITNQAELVVENLIENCQKEDFVLKGKSLIHRSAIIEENVVFKGPVFIGKNCFVAANCYLRGGVFLGEGVKVGPSCEIKSSFIFSHTNVAHLNYVGNALVGSEVNIEAGAVLANHFNERKDKNIVVRIDKETIDTKTEKFGAFIGDGSKIGANAVLSPGTILNPDSVVGRLELVK